MDDKINREKIFRISSFEINSSNHIPSLYQEFYFKVNELSLEELTFEVLEKLAVDYNLRIVELPTRSLRVSFNFVILKIYDVNGEEIGDVDPEIYLRYGEVEGFANLDLDLARLVNGEINEYEFQSKYWIVNDNVYQQLTNFYKALLGRLNLVNT